MKKITNAELLENINMEDLVMRLNEDEFAYGYIYEKEGEVNALELQVFQSRFTLKEINSILENTEESYEYLQCSKSYYSEHETYKEAIEGFMDFWCLDAIALTPLNETDITKIPSTNFYKTVYFQ